MPPRSHLLSPRFGSPQGPDSAAQQGDEGCFLQEIAQTRSVTPGQAPRRPAVREEQMRCSTVMMLA